MEADIKRWLNFASKVETTLQTMNNDIYSDRYISGIITLLDELRREAAQVQAVSSPEQQEHYFKVNSLAQKLRNTAHFAHYS